MMLVKPYSYRQQSKEQLQHVIFRVLFHHVRDTSVLSPLETWAGSLASWVLAWPDLRENSTLLPVRFG